MTDYNIEMKNAATRALFFLESEVRFFDAMSAAPSHVVSEIPSKDDAEAFALNLLHGSDCEFTLECLQEEFSNNALCTYLARI